MIAAEPMFPGAPRHNSVGGLCASLIYRLYYSGLRCVFGFGRWHARSPFARRPYKARAVALINAMAPVTLVEIGCGLGELLARTNAERRFGFDQEQNVITAARFLHGRRISFHCGDLCHSQAIADTVAGPIDLLVTVNWPHAIAFEKFKQAIKALGAATPLTYLVVDTIAGPQPGYDYHHTKTELGQLGEVVHSIDGGDGIRILHLVRLTPAAS